MSKTTAPAIAVALPLEEQYDAIADTMATVLHLENRRMPETAKQWFVAAEQGIKQLGISAMTLAEIGYLSEKKRISLTVEQVLTYVRQHDRIQIVPISAVVVEQTFRIHDIPELHDRLIAATAACRAVPVITNDPHITASQFVRAEWA
jgi:PIN domain nuclease of toxin-antitoxin system